MTARPFTSPEHLERKRGRPFALRLGANESAFGPSPRSIAAATRELAHVAWYPDSTSYELVHTIATALAVPPALVAVGGGIDDLLGFAASRLLRAGETAVTTDGTYPIFEQIVRAGGGRCATVPYRSDLTVDLPALADLAARTDARVVYVANPDNPTGSCLSDRELSNFARALPEQCSLFLDEAYLEFACDEEGSPAAAASPDLAGHPRTIRFRTFSKGYGLAGLRAGYGLLGAECAETLGIADRQPSITRIAQATAVAAFEDRDHLGSVVAEVARGRAEYADLGVRLGWLPLPSRANFVTFRLASAEAAATWVRELERHGVFVRRGFSPPLDACLRVTVGTRRERERFAEIASGIRDGRP